MSVDLSNEDIQPAYDSIIRGSQNNWLLLKYAVGHSFAVLNDRDVMPNSTLSDERQTIPVWPGGRRGDRT